MLDADKKIILDHFNDRLARFKPDDPQVVSWNSRESQQVRFRVLQGVGDLTESTVLDVGCGTGDFLAHSLRKLYTGVDVNPKMIEVARKRYPGARFEVRDILGGDCDERFDFVVASGIFALEMPDWDQVTWDMILAMWKLCRIGVAVNFLSGWTPGEMREDMHYVDPVTTLAEAADRITPKLTLRHDYRPNDFTLYMYR